MPDNWKGARSTPDSGASNRPEHVLFIAIASSAAALDELVTTLLDLGIPGATVIDSKGLGALLRQEMPIFAGLASLLPDRTGSRVVLSLARADVAESVLEHIEEELRGEVNLIACTVPLGRVVGLKR